MSPTFRPQDQSDFFPRAASTFDGSDGPQTVVVAPPRRIDRDIVVASDIDPRMKDPEGEIADRRPDQHEFVNPPLLCSRIPDAVVATRAGIVLTPDRRWIADSIGVAPLGEVADVRWRRRIRVDEPAKTVDREVAVVFSVLSDKKRTNYWHWLIEGLTRAAMLETAGAPSHVSVLIPGPVVETHRQALSAIGVDESRILEWTGEPARFRSVYLPSGPQHRAGEPIAAAISLLRERTAHLRERPPARRLWVSRRFAKRRRLECEKDLIDAAKGFGFEEVVAETTSVGDQIRAFGEAEAIAGLHGAGLGNALFMAPRTTVVEVATERVKPRGKTIFLNLAAAGDQRYAYCAGPSDAIDPRRLEQVLEAVVT